eukprot:gene7157-8534_t
MLFEDPEFPCDDTSLGHAAALRLPSVTWRRASELFPLAEAGPDLFNTIDPSDIAQGRLGNCWLLSAFSSLAEFPDSVKSSFITKETSPEGRYTIRIFDPAAAAGRDQSPQSGEKPQDWVMVTVDDYLPCCAPVADSTTG